MGMVRMKKKEKEEQWALLAVAMAAAMALWAVGGAQAAEYTVGGSSGWTLGVDYTAWASQYSFNTGDTLVFNYGTLHSVQQVNEANYGACSTANAISSSSSGNTIVKLDKEQTYYFICGVSSHCESGMQLSVKVGGASSSSLSPSTGSTTPSISNTPNMESSSAAPLLSSLMFSIFSLFAIPFLCMDQRLS